METYRRRPSPLVRQWMERRTVELGICGMGSMLTSQRGGRQVFVIIALGHMLTVRQSVCGFETNKLKPRDDDAYGMPNRSPWEFEPRST